MSVRPCVLFVLVTRTLSPLHSISHEPFERTHPLGPGDPGRKEMKNVVSLIRTIKVPDEVGSLTVKVLRELEGPGAKSRHSFWSNQPE